MPDQSGMVDPKDDYTKFFDVEEDSASVDPWVDSLLLDAEEDSQPGTSQAVSTAQSGQGRAGPGQDSVVARRLRRMGPNRAQAAKLPAEGSSQGGSILGRCSVILVTVGVIASPLCLYLSIAELDLLSFDPAGDALVYFALGTLTFVVALIGCGLALTALGRRQPRTLPLAALAAALFAGPVLTIGGVSLGVDAAQDSLRSDLDSTVGQGAADIAEHLESEGVDLGPLDPILQLIIDEGADGAEED